MKQLKSYGILENGKKGSLLTHPVNQILTVNLSHYACKAKKKNSSQGTSLKINMEEQRDKFSIVKEKNQGVGLPNLASGSL